MNLSSPQGPTIPSSTNFLTNFTRILKVTDSIKGTSFSSPNSETPGTNTELSGGTLSNLNDPISNSQGATYAYALDNNPIGNPGGIVTSVQYNNAGVFGGGTSLTFNRTTNTLTANKISNGIVTIGSNTISGLANPTTGQQAATKNYVDNSTSLSITSINTVGATTYSAADIINGLIYRDTQTSGTTTDLLPTAAQIITASDAVVGTTIKFGIKNINSDYTNVITFTPGAGITFGNIPNIFSGYQYDALMIVTNIDSGTEALTLYSLNCAITNTDNWGIEISGTATIIDTVRLTDFFMIFNSPTEKVSPFSITPTNVAAKVIYLTPTSSKNLVLQKPPIFMGILTGSDFIREPFIWKTGGMDFYIINQSVTLGANVTISGAPSGEPPSILWTIDPNSNMTIPPGYTGWFMISLTVTNFPENASLTQANVYCLGIFPNR